VTTTANCEKETSEIPKNRKIARWLPIVKASFPSSSLSIFFSVLILLCAILVYNDVCVRVSIYLSLFFSGFYFLSRAFVSVDLLEDVLQPL
jgi:hypothetical protein